MTQESERRLLDALPLLELDVLDRTIVIDLAYPHQEFTERPLFVEVGIMDTRSADSIRISYDFNRDGYRIEQAAVFTFESDDTVCDPDWQEVAFVKAWARRVNNYDEALK